jgi:putative ABC transport system permease protein
LEQRLMQSPAQKTVVAAVGLPLGVLLAQTFADFASQHLNLVITSGAVPWTVLALAAGLGLGVPLLAAAVPVLRAARMPARVVLADLGTLAARRGPGPAARWLAPTSRLALRNAVRRPVRTSLTVGALALGGALLLTAGNVYASLQGALASAIAGRGEDISVRLLQPAPAEALAREVLAVPGVRAVETWAAARVALALPGRAGTSRYTLFAPPEDTTLTHPRLVAGRWPQPGETAVAVNRTLQDSEDGLDLGAEVTLLLEKRRAAAPIVGVIEEVAEPALYTSVTGFTALTGLVGTAGDLRVVTTDVAPKEVASALEEALLARGWFPLDVMTHDAYGQALADHFVIVLISLTLISLAAITVGGLGLATSMSLGVLGHVFTTESSRDRVERFVDVLWRGLAPRPA